MLFSGYDAYNANYKLLNGSGFQNANYKLMTLNYCADFGESS
jgi:hypothetical protein